MAIKKKRPVRKTLIIVGEGITDCAFLKHMQRLYDNNQNWKITIKAGDGGSPKNVIHAASKRRDISYDEKWVLIDSDIKLTEKDKKFAQICKVQIIQSIPLCIEGVLLEVLGKKIPTTSKECKKKLEPLLSGKPVSPNSYETQFPKNVLDNSQIATIVKLRKLFNRNNAQNS